MTLLITGAEFQSLGDVAAANNEHLIDLNHQQQQKQQQHDFDSSKSTQTRYDKKIHKRSTPTSNRDLVNTANLNAFLENQGPKKVSLSVPQYQSTMQSNVNGAVPSGNMRAQSVPSNRMPPSYYAQYAPERKNTVQVNGGQAIPEASGIPPNRVNIGPNPARNAVRVDVPVQRSMPQSEEPAGSLEKTNIESSTPILNWDNDEETYNHMDVPKTAVQNPIERHESRPQSYADQMVQTIRETPAPHNADLAFENVEEVNGDADEQHENGQHFKKFIRRVSPCEQKLLFSPQKNYESTYYHYDSELPNKFRNWEDDILKELRNRFYSCCEECKKKVLDGMHCKCPSANPSPPSPPNPSRPRPILPEVISADGDEAQVAQQLQLIVDSLSLEQKRNLARLYNRIPKRADRVST